MRPRRALFAALGALCLSSAWPRPVRADETTEQARVYFDAGAQAYAAGRYPVAIEAFNAAYRLAARPALLFSLAQAERKQFWVDKKPEGATHAIQHYRAYLAEVAEGGRRDDAVTALGELEPVVARLGDAGTSGAGATPGAASTRLLLSSRAVNARAAIDGAAEAPLPRLLDLPSGKHHVAVVADGYYADERDVVVLPGVTTPVELNLREQPALLTVQAEAGATAVVDGRVLGELSSHPFEVTSGHHTLAVVRNGRQLFQQELTLERGRARSVIAPLTVTRQRRIAQVVLASGGAAVVASGAFLGVTLAEEAAAQRIHDQRQTGNITAAQLAQYNSDLSARDAWRVASIVTVSAGAAVLGAGAALFFFDHPASPATPARPGGETQPAPALGAPGCGCTVEVSLLPSVSPAFAGGGVVGVF